MNVTSIKEIPDRKTTDVSSNSPLEFTMSVVVECLPEGGCQLQSGLVGYPALSCLVEPLVGDTVLLAEVQQEVVIVAIVSRSSCSTLTLSSEQGQGLEIKAASIALTSENGVHVHAQDSIKLSAPFGSLQTISASLIQSVAGSLVTVAQTIINKTTHFQLNAEESIVSQAKVQSITAENDLFMDADRINMG